MAAILSEGGNTRNVASRLKEHAFTASRRACRTIPALIQQDVANQSDMDSKFLCGGQQNGVVLDSRFGLRVRI